jgi:hypothetical protein
VTATTPTHSNLGGFRHEAVFYAGNEEFVGRLTPFIQAGVAARQPTLVVVAAPKIDALRTALGPDASYVEFADMSEVGRNPARIIPAWSEFVRRNADAPAIRGIGEPIDAQRSPAELAECRLMSPCSMWRSTAARNCGCCVLTTSTGSRPTFWTRPAAATPS